MADNTGTRSALIGFVVALVVFGGACGGASVRDIDIAHRPILLPGCLDALGLQVACLE